MRPALALVGGRDSTPRWRCPGCGDGGTALDLVLLVRRCSADEAVTELEQWQADRRPAATPPALESPGTGRRAAPLAVILRDERGEREVVVDAAVGATVGDLAHALTTIDAGRLVIDGGVISPATRLAASGLREGSVISPADAESPRGLASRAKAMPAVSGRQQASSQEAVVELRWVAGLDAGRTDRLAAGSWLAGAHSRAAIRRRDAGAAQAAIVEVGPTGELRVEPLHGGAAEVVPAPARS
jgi:hypothetical protein